MDMQTGAYYLPVIVRDDGTFMIIESAGQNYYFSVKGQKLLTEEEVSERRVQYWKDLCDQVTAELANIKPGIRLQLAKDIYIALIDNGGEMHKDTGTLVDHAVGAAELLINTCSKP